VVGESIQKQLNDYGDDDDDDDDKFSYDTKNNVD
jgi:hypothetical protein